MIRQHSLRTGDTVEGVIVAPRENERYFALTNVTQDQLRGTDARQAQGCLRQPDAALS
jgi:transcription termination factor Rho